MIRRFWPWAAAIVFMALSLLVWLPATDGSKESDLGSALLGGVVVGLALLTAERLFSRSAADRERLAAIDSASQGVPNVAPAKDEDPRSRDSNRVPEAGHRYEVEYEGSMRDMSRIDAQQLRLRVFRDGEYFQFVIIPIAGPALRGVLGPLSDTALSQFWRAVAVEAGPLINAAVLRGDIPLPDPTQGFEVYPDLEAAGRAAPQEPAVGDDDVVYEFVLDR